MNKTTLQKPKPIKGYTKVQLLRCSQTKLIRTSLIPSNDELEDHYSEYPYIEQCPKLTIDRYKETLETFESFRKNNMLLEVGCGAGFFLLEAKNKQWIASGIEKGSLIKEKLREKNIVIHNDLFNKSELKNNSFDVIVMIEVIEHLPDPVLYLNRCFELLRPGGAIYITTPNFNCIERRILKNEYRIISYPEHIWYFTPLSLHKTLSKNNFSRKRLKTHGFSISEFKKRKENGANAQENDFDTCFRAKAETSRFKRFLIRSANIILNLFRIGNTIKAFYVKPIK